MTRTLLLTLALGVAFFWLVLLSGDVNAADEGSINSMKADPTPFSPGNSPGKFDKASIDFELTRELPIWLEVCKDDRTVLVVESPDIRRHVGQGNDRYVWLGQDGMGRPCEDGVYTLRAMCRAELAWRFGDPTAERDRPGVIRNPHAIALADNGTLYVSGSDGAVQVFGPDGKFISRIQPALPKGASRLGWIHAMILLDKDTLLVRDDRHVVKVKVADGTASVLIDLSDQKKRLDWLDGMAVDSRGRIFLACESTGVVQVFSADGKKASTIGDKGSDEAKLTKPSGITVGPKDEVFVTDLTGRIARIAVFDKNGKYLRSIHTTLNGGELPLGFPREIAAMADGSLIVSEGSASRATNVIKMKMLAHITSSGKLLGSWGDYGAGEGQFKFIGRIATNGKDIVAADHYDNHRVVRMSAAGKIQQTYTTPAGIIVDPVAIVPLGPEHYAIFDQGLSRCTVLDRDGKLTASWPYWQLTPMDTSEGVVFGGSRTDKKVYMASPLAITVLDEQGRLVRTIQMQLPKGQVAPVSGLLVDGDGTMLLSCGQFGLAPYEAMPLIGKLLVLDPDGKLIQTVAAPLAGGAYFGQVVSYDPKQPDRVAVQYSWRDEKKRTAAALAILHIRPGEPIQIMGDDGKIHKEKPRPPEKKEKSKSESTDAAKVLGIIATAELFDGNGPVRVTNDGPLAAGNGCFFRGVGEVACYSEAGRYLWSLGGMQDKPLSAKALLHDGDRLLVVSDQTGHVECWKIAENPRVLAEMTVEIDNTNPIAEVQSIEQLVQSKDEPLEIRGTVVDRNLQKYMIYTRAMPSKNSGYTRWQAVQRKDYTQPVTNAVLGECKVSIAFRDRGIEVKVIAWDTAGNTSESQPIEVQFDDDGDGMSNSYEVNNGTDPHKTTEIREAGDVQIQIDVATLMLPYLFASKEHSLQLTAWDNADPAYPRQLSKARLDVSVDVGQFAGGTAGENGANTISTTSSQFKYTAPQVQQQTVTVTVNFPEQPINNVIYPATTAAFELDVQQDDDEDWLPDSLEIAAGSDNGVDTFKNNPDSDGDGVIDGYDLAPRTSYSGSSDWSSIYEPGMIRYTADFQFFGIGGGTSRVIKYGDVCSGKNIMRSERTQNPDQMKEYLNELLFDRKNKDESKRKPFEVIDWKHFSIMMPEQEQKIGVFQYGGSGHPEYYFHYYALSSEGTPVIENIETIDGTKYTEGIHRNFLKVSFPGCDEYVDRTLTIQCRVTGQDLTGEGGWARPMMKLAWLVEFFCESNLHGEHLQFSTFAISSPVCRKTYEAKAVMPGEKFFRNCGVYVKLTPCWLVRTRGLATCPNCRNRQTDEFDNCPICGSGLNRYSFKPIDKSQISVSGVQMETASESVQWVQRLKPRGNMPMDADIFDEICVQAIKAMDQYPNLHWPLEDDVQTLNITVGGKMYRIAICSVRGMTRKPKNLKTAECQEHMKQRALQLSNLMANMDVVCLVANTERQLQTLADAVNWGADGVWREVSVSLDDVQNATAQPESETPTGADEAESADTSSETGQSKDIYADLAKAKTYVMTLKKWYSCYKDVKKWNESRGYWNLAAGDSKRFGEVLNLKTADPVTGQLLQAQRSIAIQKRFDGGFYVSTRTVVKRPYTVWTDPKTGITVTDRSRSQELILHRTENVVDPDNSKLIERSKQFPGTVPSNWKVTLDHVTTGLKVGAVIISNGLRFYQCYEEGDKIGMAVFFTKGVVEGAHIVASAKKVDSVFVSGLAITKTGGSKISIVGVAVGVLETGYNAYKWSQLDNPIDKNQAVEDTIACAFDAGIGALEPWGGVILASWTVGVKLGDWVSDLWGLKESPAGSSVVSSPGQALVFLPLHWLPKSVPPGIARSAVNDAQLEAEKIVKQHNAIWNRKQTYLFVPPK